MWASTVRELVRDDAVWAQIAPHLSRYVRTLNKGIPTIDPVIMEPAQRRAMDLFAEASVRVLARAAKASSFSWNEPLGVDDTWIEQSTLDALNEIIRLRAASQQPALSHVPSRVTQHVRVLAERLRFQFSKFDGTPVLGLDIAGVGSLRTATADAIVGSVLCEIKTVTRQFQSAHLRQLLSYFAMLRLAKNAPAVERLALLNPFLGIEWSERADGVVWSVARCSVDEFTASFGHLMDDDTPSL